ncbi:glycine-rich domain-containing protein 1-like isoform X1 [Salvia splendens]|uniref:glycine-rich domain-containing protein 1-like isoform X1 n=1 Tax=Salvia splendens TaxID=180675 RepID=UPI001C2749C1|nr:glycine-rich domain-containing protein 1-like isoform X1 [Salvia splendens]
MSASEGAASMRTLSEISEEETVHFSVDLVAAARRNIRLFRSVSVSPWHNHKPTIFEAVRRYDEIWMPLIADLTTGSKPPMLLPPLDVEWVWFCHTLNWANYRDYCQSRFSKLIGKPNIFDEENEDYALERCRKVWEHKFLSEPFENEADGDGENYPSSISEDLLDQVSRCSSLCRMYAEPYYSEMVYLVAARQRYRGFIYMVHRFGDECSCIVPTSDVYLMWLTHQSYPTVYAVDFKELEGDVWKIVWVGGAMKEEDMEETKMLWEKPFDQPYEKAGGAAITRPIVEPPFYWDVTNTDVNTKYKSLVPRFLFEVCIAVKLISNTKQVKRNPSRDFLRLRTAKCHRELKMDKPISHFMPETWQKAWHVYCEFGTKGLILDLRHHGGFCSRGSTLLDSKLFSWNDLLRAPSLASEKGIDDRARVVTSITPPVQAPYFLKCVPDRVTDDSGAMISDVILKMNQYRPQEGRWLSRTVLDHGGRECFVIRMRVGGGFYRRGGEAPKAVKWEDRIIQIFEGSWSYVIGSGSIGRSPEKLVGTATPKSPKEELQTSWKLSSGIELVIQWDSSKSISGLRFDLQSETSSEPMVKLLQGRHMQYKVKKSSQETQEGKADTKNEQMEQDVRSEEDEYVTMVRFSEEIPSGKATALLNWKLLVVEVLPEEDAVLVLLLGMAILRSVSEMKREDVGRLLVRRRIGEAKVGERDWGSVMLHPSSYSPLVSCSKLHPWYWNAKAVMASQARDHQGVAPTSSNYSQAEGGDNLYRSGIIP